MEDKSVCYYCGTIYDKELGKCPLCGSTVKSSQDEAARPQPRQRLTEKERKERRRQAKGKYSSKKKSSVSARPILIAALVLLILAVLVMAWFIADMIGWIPGLEDRVERDSQTVQTENKGCEELTISAANLRLEAADATAELEVRVNLYCEETVFVNSSDGSVVSVSDQAVTGEDETGKTAIFTLTAHKEGKAEIKVTCGDRQAVCAVVCDFSGSAAVGDPTADEEPPASDLPNEPSGVPEDYVPLLNSGDITLLSRGDKIALRVTNLPAGEQVSWFSTDESVAKVNSYGEVTAIGGGKAKIRVTVCGKTTELLVRCNFGDFIDEGAHLDAYRSDVTVSVGETFALYLYDSDGERIEDVVYVIGDPDICEVTDGIVKAIGYGTTVVTVDYYGVEFECIVRVR